LQRDGFAWPSRCKRDLCLKVRDVQDELHVRGLVEDNLPVPKGSASAEYIAVVA